MTKSFTFDERRKIFNPGDKSQTLNYAVEHLLTVAEDSIKKRGHFYIALSGGSTPKAIYKELAEEKNAKRIDWKDVSLFWSDERCVSPEDDASNYKMAMDTGFAKLPIPLNQIHRMKGEVPPEEAADEYNKLIQQKVPEGTFDFMMLGMGDDGHTASLFPFTEALDVKGKEATANFLPLKDTWRLTLTYECINRARDINIYVLGEGKADTLKQVLTSPFEPKVFPIQNIGTVSTPANWVVDTTAFCKLRETADLK